ncbi:MAG: amidohydrolase family protein [Verrucomicrobia bacterium]|nr:amidohydrolase family protein [Verrucomicrobiota bacterium]
MRTPLPRRSFLQAFVAGTGHLIAASSGFPRTAAPDPAPVRIIDTHTHFYDPARPGGVPWPPKTDSLLHRTVLPQHFRALPVPQKIDATVVVEASPLVEDNQWILDLAGDDPFIVGFVGNLPVGTAEFRGLLRRFARNPLFRGIRVRGVSLANGLGQPGFVDDLKALAAAGLTLDIPSPPEAVAQVPRLVAAVPDLRVVVNHVANARIDGGAPAAAWRDLIAAVAARPHVYMKVSGLVEGTRRTSGDAPGEVEFYRPTLDALWSAFGPSRLIFGSNWPVSERFAPLARVEGILLDYVRPRGQEALDRIFWRNAAEAYRWVNR